MVCVSNQRVTWRREEPWKQTAAPSPEGLPAAGGGPAPAAEPPPLAEGGVLVAVQLRLGHHEAAVVLRAAVFDTCTPQDGALHRRL